MGADIYRTRYDEAKQAPSEEHTADRKQNGIATPDAPAGPPKHAFLPCDWPAPLYPCPNRSLGPFDAQLGAVQSYVDVHRVDVFAYLEGGGLLGLYRDGQLIPGDNDVDVRYAVRGENPAIREGLVSLVKRTHSDGKVDRMAVLTRGSQLVRDVKVGSTKVGSVDLANVYELGEVINPELPTVCCKVRCKGCVHVMN